VEFAQLSGHNLRELGIMGAIWGKGIVITTIADESLERPKDLIKRHFVSFAPNELWCSDIAYVKTGAGWAYVAFIIDVFSKMIVGWKVANSLKSDLATDALAQAMAQRSDTEDLIHHSDRGVQCLSVAFSTTLLAAGIRPSVGTTGDSYDNALAESLNGLYKTELIHAIGICDDEIAVEWETCKWVGWFNNRRLHSSIGMMSPVEYKALYCAQRKSGNHLIDR
jgi:putative transposase